MKNLFYLSAMVLTGMIIFFSGCKDDSDPVLPTITLNNATGYTSADVSVPYGDTLLFGVTAASNGTDNLVKFRIIINDQVGIDSTINTATFTADYYLIKSVNDEDEVLFEVTDISGNINTLTITLTGDFGAINTYSSIILGAQNNATIESFLSFSNSTFTLYFQNDAFDHQADIDMFCFYENTVEHQNFMTLAAPGSNITGIFTGTTAPDFYTILNTTWFVKTSLPAAAFDAVDNDALVIAHFDVNNKFRKAKTLAAGEVYAFQIASGKYGLFKVLTVTGVEDGTLEIAVKIQQ